jgi:hypothetical protein
MCHNISAGSLCLPRSSFFVPVLPACRRILLLFVAFALPALADPDARTIHGVVLNSATQEPVPRALVVSDDQRFAALTDDNGAFSFTSPAPAQPNNSSNRNGRVFDSSTTVLRASKPGFLADSSLVLAVRDSDPADKLRVLYLTPEALIVGHVSLPSAGSFDRMSVLLYRRQVADGRARWLPAGSERVRVDGEFRFSELPAGTYKAFTDEFLDRDPLTYDPNGQQFGYPPAFYSSAADFASATPIYVTSGQTAEIELSPALQPYYPIKIFVSNANPGSGFNVTVSLLGHYGPGFTLGYNPGTRTVEGLLPNGTYTLDVIGYEPQPTSGSLTFSVHNAPVENAPLLLSPGGSIPVTIRQDFTPANTNASGSSSRPSPNRVQPVVTLVPADDFSPLPGASLRTRNRENTPDPMLENVLPGRYWVRMENFEYYPSAITSDGSDLLANPLVVAAGGSSSPIDITLRDDFAQISGTVDVPSDAPLPQSPTVYCIPYPESLGRLTPAAVETGSGNLSFQCPNLPPSSYLVLAFDRPQPELEYHNPEAMRAYESKGAIIRVEGNQKESVRVPLIHE